MERSRLFGKYLGDKITSNELDWGFREREVLGMIFRFLGCVTGDGRFVDIRQLDVYQGFRDFTVEKVDIVF